MGHDADYLKVSRSLYGPYKLIKILRRYANSVKPGIHLDLYRELIKPGFSDLRTQYLHGPDIVNLHEEIIFHHIRYRMKRYSG